MLRTAKDELKESKHGQETSEDGQEASGDGQLAVEETGAVPELIVEFEDDNLTVLQSDITVRIRWSPNITDNR